MQNALVKHAAMIGLFVVVLYILCLGWKLSITDPEVAKFHLTALKLAFPGFKGYDATSLALGGVLSFIYGFVASLIFHGLHRGCCRAN